MNQPGDMEEAPAGSEIGVSEGQKVLWECRSLSPSFYPSCVLVRSMVTFCLVINL